MSEFTQAREKQIFYEQCALLAREIDDMTGVKNYTIVAQGWDYEACKLFKQRFHEKEDPNENIGRVFARTTPGVNTGSKHHITGSFIIE